MKFGKMILLVPFVLGLISCGSEKDTDKIGDAQACLDKLNADNPAGIDKCLVPISHLDTPQAESLRCTAGFLKEGLATGQRIVAGFDRLGSNPSSDKTLGMMEILSFTSKGAPADDFQNARTTYASCLKSGAKGATLLASFSYLSMSLVGYMSSKVSCATAPVTDGTTGFVYYNLKACADVTDLDPLDPADQPKILALVELVNPATVDADAAGTQAGIGAVIIGTAQVSCPSGSSANKELCGMIKDAISAAGGSGNPRAVAIQFFSQSLAFPSVP